MMEAAEVFLKQIETTLISAKGIFETDRANSISFKGSGYQHCELSGGGVVEAQSGAGPEGLFPASPFCFDCHNVLLSEIYIVGGLEE